MAFFGNYRHTLDAKNRLFIPAKYREGLGNSCILFSPKDENCLYLYNENDWDTISNDVIATGNVNMQRYIFDDAMAVEVDKQGRITIKAEFCKRVGLEKEVIVAGAGKRVELWSEANREAAMRKATDQSDTYPKINF